MNHRAKFDAASFILVGEITNRTNTHTHTKLQQQEKQTNSKRYIHTLPIGMSHVDKYISSSRLLSVQNLHSRRHSLPGLSHGEYADGTG